MRVLRGRILFTRSWCHGVCQLSGELKFNLDRIFDSRQLHVQRRLYGAQHQLYSVSGWDIQSWNRKCGVLDVSRVFRRVL